MLELKAISYKIGKRVLLRDVSYVFGDEEFVAITGPNGAGKSTLLQIIMGIRQPSSGEIYWNGQNITKLSITERAKLGLAYAFQQAILFKGLTVKDLLQIAATSNETFLIDQRTDYAQLLQTVGLDPESYLDREINDSLSGGELKRIEIASAFARNAALTMFDEPEAGIDLWSFDKLIQLFRRRTGEATIVVSHQERILKIADKVLKLENGELTEVTELC